VDEQQLSAEVCSVSKLLKLFRTCTSFIALIPLDAHSPPCTRSPTIPDVTIVNRQKFFLSRQIDSDAGEKVLHAIQAMGVQVLTSVSVQDITTTLSDSGEEEFTGLDLTDGTHVEAALVIFAIGTTPRDDLAKDSSIDCYTRGGVVVGDDLTMSAKDVYAIGECANWRGNTYGLIGPGGRSSLKKFRHSEPDVFCSRDDRHSIVQSDPNRNYDGDVQTSSDERPRSIDKTGVDVSAPNASGVASDCSSLLGRFFREFLRRQTYNREIAQRTCVWADLGDSGSFNVRHQ
jgi:hypothetical protein